MGILRYPGRPIPFVEQKSPRQREGKGLGIGAVIFVITLFGILLAILYLVPPLMDDVEFQDIGIPYPTLFLIILGGLIVVSTILMLKPRMYVSSRIGYKERDPAICQRVIRDGIDGPELIISGPRESTFSQVCRDNWAFANVPQKTAWFIRDEKGNDVTNMPLGTADGVFTLIPEYASETSKQETSEADEYSSIHDSVTYYD
ncbi:hypothetical protein EU528_10485 [Candidatus Thorarchaeota archaeon]|nr:MAG: hypothetical protein EU528_10485 [Candidatus Thorarchaeota archaeon]